MTSKAEKPLKNVEMAKNAVKEKGNGGIENGKCKTQTKRRSSIIC